MASHVLEHIANPLKAIHEWLRVVNDEGIILLIIPHKEATFDHKRDVTTLNHLKEDFENNIDEKDLKHLSEILKLHDYDLHNPTGDMESFKERSLQNYENRCLHQHVFDTDFNRTI
jgi:SAM-dependent methyltransferase